MIQIKHPSFNRTLGVVTMLLYRCSKCIRPVMGRTSQLLFLGVLACLLLNGSQGKIPHGGDASNKYNINTLSSKEKEEIVLDRNLIVGFLGDPGQRSMPNVVNDIDMKIETVFQWKEAEDRDFNTDTPTMFRFVPGSDDHIVTMLENGLVKLFYGPDDASGSTGRVIIDAREDVWMKIAGGGIVFDPDYPAVPYIYQRYRGAPKDEPLPNTKIDTSRRQNMFAWGCPTKYTTEDGPLGPAGTMENSQYCKGAPENMCETFEYVDRVVINPVTCDFISRTTIVRIGCSAQFSHTRQGIEIMNDKSMLFTIADNTQAGYIYDEGSELRDGCFNSAEGYPQGLFRPQRMAFQTGKAISIEPDVYRTQSYIKEGEGGFRIIGKGLHQPFRFAVNKYKNQAELGDVGDGDGGSSERFFTISKDKFINAGWPCVEGLHRPGMREIERREWLSSKGYDVCDGVYEAKETGGATGDKDFVEAHFTYRDGPIDPHYNGCQSGGAAISAVYRYYGGPTGGLLSEKYKNSLVFADYPRSCILRFDGDSEGNFDWSKRHFVIDGENVGMGICHMEVSPKTGHLYMLDYRQDRLVRVSNSMTDAAPINTQALPDPEVPNLVNHCESSTIVEELQWTQLEDGSFETTLSMDGGWYENIHGRTRTRAYNGLIPGPTMRMVAGKTYHVILKNDHDLGWPNYEGEIENTFQRPCTTNIHTHGLHMSGTAPADDVSIAVAPGESYRYTYKIPADHSGGLHFYHNHHHGSTTIQGGAGATGLLVIEDNIFLRENMKPIDWPIDMKEIFLIMMYMSPTVTQSVAQTSEDKLYTTTATEDHSLFNGCDSSNYEMKVIAGKWTRLRMLHVGHETNAILSIVPNGDDEECQVGLLGLDGVYLSKVPRMLPSSAMFFTLSSRVDVIIRCPADSTHTLQLINQGTGDVVSSSKIVVLPNVGGYDPIVLGEWSPRRPYYLTDLSEEGVVDNKFDVDLKFTGEINKKAFRTGGEPLVKIKINDIQEWSITNSGQHPFHIHTNHMQLKGGTLGWGNLLEDFYQVGDWLDTTLFPGIATVRFRPERYGGIAPMHCHVYSHADKGMAGYMEIEDGYGALGGPEIVNMSSPINLDPIDDLGSTMCQDPYSPNELEWVQADDGVFESTIRLGVQTLTINSRGDTLQTRSWNGMIPGPLIRVRACGMYRIKVVNELDKWANFLDIQVELSKWANLPDIEKEINKSIGAYLTHLKLHGMHIGEQPMVGVQPGAEYALTFVVPCDRVGGTHWYHAEQHGITALQAGGGAAGMVVVDDAHEEGKTENGIPDDIANIPTAHIIVQEVNVGVLNELAMAAEDSIWKASSLITEPVYLTNGCNNLRLHVKAGYWTRVRTIVHAISGNFLLNFFGGNRNNGHRCKIGVLAKDGVYLNVVPRILSTPFQGIPVSDSGRVDVVINCPNEWIGNYELPITLLKYPEPNDVEPISKRVGTLVVSTAMMDTSEGHNIDIVELPEWKPCRPFYLADLTRLWTTSAEANHDYIKVNEMGINDELYGPEKYQKRVLQEGQVLQWSFESNMNVNLHVSTNKMQIVSGPFNPYYAPEWDQVGDWIDVARIRIVTQANLDAFGNVNFESNPNLVVRLVLDRWSGGMEIESQNYLMADSGVKGKYLINGGQRSTANGIAVLRYGTCAPASSHPFGGEAFPAPGVFQAANFDEGGIEVSYGYYRDEDNDNSNVKDIPFIQTAHQDTSIRVHDSTDVVRSGGAYEVVDLSAGDWLSYSVKVNTTSTYKFGVRMRSSFGALAIKLNNGDCASREGFTDDIQQLEFGKSNRMKEDFESLIGLRKFEIPAGIHRLFICVSEGDDISLSTASILNAV